MRRPLCSSPSHQVSVVMFAQLCSTARTPEDLVDLGRTLQFLLKQRPVCFAHICHGFKRLNLMGEAPIWLWWHAQAASPSGRARPVPLPACRLPSSASKAAPQQTDWCHARRHDRCSARCERCYICRTRSAQPRHHPAHPVFSHELLRTRHF